MILWSHSDTMSKPSWFTPWSFIHFFTGFILFIIIKIIFPKITLVDNFLIVMCIHTIYEIKDMCYAYIHHNGSKWTNNSFINSIGDTICAAFGFIVGYIALNNASNSTIILMMLLYVISVIYYANDSLNEKKNLD